MIRRWLLASRLWLLVILGPILSYRVSLNHLHLGISTSLIVSSLVPLAPVIDQAQRRGNLEVVGAFSAIRLTCLEEANIYTIER